MTNHERQTAANDALRRYITEGCSPATAARLVAEEWDEHIAYAALVTYQQVMELSGGWRA